MCFVTELPKKPIIYDAQGRVVVGVARFFEGYDLRLTCQVSDGKFLILFLYSFELGFARIEGALHRS